MMPAFAEASRAIHRGESDLPFVDFGDGVSLQLLQVDLDQGLWVVRTRFQPGVTIATHKHTGPVFAVTLAGSWKYLEYPDVNTAGSYLFEPAGSVHTLTVPKTETAVTDVWFAIYGANLNLDANGNVEAVIDAELIHNFYLAACESQGLPAPAVIRGAH
ncbi:MAG: 2,4'-dihydroxyacetophenone dioxygenase family protein [Candidatus Binatia bacterium]